MAPVIAVVAIHGVHPQNQVGAVHGFAVEIPIELHGAATGPLPGAAVVELIGTKLQDPRIGHCPRIGETVLRVGIDFVAALRGCGLYPPRAALDRIVVQRCLGEDAIPSRRGAGILLRGRLGVILGVAADVEFQPPISMMVVRLDVSRIDAGSEGDAGVDRAVQVEYPFLGVAVGARLQLRREHQLVRCLFRGDA